MSHLLQVISYEIDAKFRKLSQKVTTIVHLIVHVFLNDIQLIDILMLILMVQKEQKIHTIEQKVKRFKVHKCHS